MIDTLLVIPISSAVFQDFKTYPLSCAFSKIVLLPVQPSRVLTQQHASKYNYIKLLSMSCHIANISLQILCFGGVQRKLREMNSFPLFNICTVVCSAQLPKNLIGCSREKILDEFVASAKLNLDIVENGFFLRKEAP